MNVPPDRDIVWLLYPLAVSTLITDLARSHPPLPLLLLFLLFAVGVTGGLLLRQLLPRTPRLWAGCVSIITMNSISFGLAWSMARPVPLTAIEMNVLALALALSLLPDPPDRWKRRLLDRLPTVRLPGFNRAVPRS